MIWVMKYRCPQLNVSWRNGLQGQIPSEQSWRSGDRNINLCQYHDCFLFLSIKRFKPLINRRQRQKTNPLAEVNGESTRGGGDSHIKSTGVLIGNFEKTPWYRHDWNFLSQNKTLYRVIFSAYTLKGTIKGPSIDLLRLNNLKGFKTDFFLSL